jgi:hypothetical protein
VRTSTFERRALQDYGTTTIGETRQGTTIR